MQLKLSTDYTIRIVLYLSIKKQIVSSKELSDKLEIPELYIIKFCEKLNNAGLIHIHYGIQNSFDLAKSPNQITMFEIIDIMENTTKINFCLEEDAYCSRFAIDNCPVRSFYCVLQNKIETSLKETTIQDLLKNRAIV